MIGERVRHARIYHGWNQADLGEMAGVSQSAISQIEKGDSVSEETLNAIAKATGFASWFFKLGDLPDLPDGSLRFRKRASTPTREIERIRAHVRQSVEALARLTAIADPPPVRIRPIGHDETVDAIRIEALALEARGWLGVGSLDPIPNLTRAVERSGVPVLGSITEIERHYGASYWPDYPTGRPIICVSRGSGDRERLTIAHELGHLVLHQLRTVSADEAEGEAFRFAGALLIPREAAIDEIAPPVTLRSLALVKARWGIAISALVRRSLDLGIIDQRRRTSLEKQISARGWRKNEPVEVRHEEPTLFRTIAQVATGTTRPTELVQHLGLPPLAIRSLVA
jgi:Zn-dependent peptidase ImmA (M78 family)/transcriptional regulator with XRE-family HTH domain